MEKENLLPYEEKKHSVARILFDGCVGGFAVLGFIFFVLLVAIKIFGGHWKFESKGLIEHNKTTQQ